MRAGAALVALGLAVAAASATAAPAPCADEFRRGALCRAANEEAHRLLAARNLSGAIVVEDVLSGAVVSFGSNSAQGDADPPIDIASPILPLSVSKLFLAASAWEHRTDDATFDQRVHEMIVHSDDDEGRKLATTLRTNPGEGPALADLARYGLPACGAAASDKDPAFWGSARASLALTPPRACTTLDVATDEAKWASALSLGEDGFSVSLLSLARFMQAIGNNGLMIAPAISERGSLREQVGGTRIMPSEVSDKLERAMIDVVARGTGKGVNGRVRGEWRLAGKTGSSAIHGEPFDGVFVALLFDREGTARYAAAIYVRRGGYGGGAAAEIAADLFNYALGL